MPAFSASSSSNDPRMELSERLSRHVGGFEDPRLASYLALSAGRVMLNAARRGGDWLGVTDEKLRHIADWLKAEIRKDASWMKNVDDKDRPKKLMKFSTIDDIVSEADKAMLTASQQLSSVILVEGDEALFAQLDDGYHVVRLLTPAALDRESATMQHCIGNGGYDDQLGDGDHLYLSLRDGFGKPHATMEIEKGKVVQLQGKQNKPPIEKHLDRIIPLIRECGYPVDIPASHLGHVVDKNGDWHRIENLPDGLTVDVDLNLSGTGITTLPYGLTVGGDLDLSDTDITTLPDGLVVGGSLNLYGSGITALPFRLTVGGDFDLFRTDVTTLPDGLVVGGNLNLYGTAITALPDELKVGGTLYLSDMGITVLPDGLTVGKTLYLRGTGITTLPDSINDKTVLYTNEGRETAEEFRSRTANFGHSVKGGGQYGKG